MSINSKQNDIKKKSAYWAVGLILFFACRQKDSRFTALEDYFRGHQIDITGGNYRTIISFNDNSCDVCYKNLEYYVQHLKDTNYLLLYISASKKVIYENTFISAFIPRQRFLLIPDMKLFDIVSGITRDYKGSYEIKADDGKITSVDILKNY